MDPRRALPSVERVAEALAERFPSTAWPLLVHAARQGVADARAETARAGEGIDPERVVDAAAAHVVGPLQSLQPVVNATGVLVHTNLGRAPLGSALIERVAQLAVGYTNLELHLDTGGRGSRHEHAGALLARAAGAEAGVVVNNNAAAVLLALAALARGREVVVSRGELVEIGGGFRVPEIMAESGARLVEVGTTNRTRRSDYERAITADTALVLKVHTSNYRMIGFTESTPVEELATLGPPVMVDAGSGLLDERTPWLPHQPAWLHDEPGVRQCLAAGASLVAFSGDKLLGGPQGGVLVGRRALLDRVQRHPLARAVRADKLSLAGLQAVAQSYLEGRAGELPLWRMATRRVEELHERAQRIAATSAGLKVVDTEAVMGGGSLPGVAIASVGVRVEVGDVDRALAALRARRIVARADTGGVVCDLRTVDDADDPVLAAALAELVR